MNNGLNRLLLRIGLCVLLSVGILGLAWGKVPEGYRDIKLGMKKPQVLDLLQKGPSHFSYDDLGGQIGEIIRGDDLFRYATYRFSDDGVLIEISLHMREILGRDRVLEIYNSQNGLVLAPLQGLVESGFSIEVQENSLVMKIVTNKETHAAKGAH